MFFSTHKKEKKKKNLCSFLFIYLFIIFRENDSRLYHSISCYTIKKKRKEEHSSNQMVSSFSFATLARTRATQVKCIIKKRKKKRKNNNNNNKNKGYTNKLFTNHLNILQNPCHFQITHPIRKNNLFRQFHLIQLVTHKLMFFSYKENIMIKIS